MCFVANALIYMEKNCEFGVHLCDLGTAIDDDDSIVRQGID